MEIVYCQQCGVRIADSQSSGARQIGAHWICKGCLAKVSTSETGEAPPVDVERNRSTVKGPPPVRRATSTSVPGREREPARPASPVPLLALGGGGLVFLIGIVVFFASGSKSPPPEAGGKDAKAAASKSASTGTTPATPTPTPANVATPSPAVAPSPAPATTVAQPVPVPAPADPGPATPTAPSAALREPIAREKFAPLKARFEKARSEQDVKTMGEIASDLGMITRDFEGTSTAEEAMRLIKESREAKAALGYKDIEKRFNELKNGADLNEELSDLVEKMAKFGQERKDTDLGKSIELTLKEFREKRAEKMWAGIKPRLAKDGAALHDALDEAGRLIRDYGGTPSYAEATRALQEAVKKETDAAGYTAAVHFLSEFRRAPNVVAIRKLMSELRAYKDSGAGGDPALDDALRRAAWALDKCVTPRARPRKVLNITFARDPGPFKPWDGSTREPAKDDKKEGMRYSAKGKDAVNVYCSLSGTIEENAEFTLAYKADGLKGLSLLIYSLSHGELFEHPVKDFRNNNWNTLKVSLETIRKDGKSLHNAELGFLMLRAQKMAAGDDKAGLFLVEALLDAGRAGDK